MRYLLALVLASALAGSAMAETVNLCVHSRAGWLRLSDHCRGRETPLVIEIPDPVPAPPSETLHVLDGSGRDLGVLVETGGASNWLIWLPHIEAIVTLDASNGVLSTTSANRIFFSEPGCQGDPYVLASRGHLLHRTEQPNGATFHLATGEPAILEVLMQSELGEDPGTPCKTGPVGPIDAALAREISDEDVGFFGLATLPLTVKSLQ